MRISVRPARRQVRGRTPFAVLVVLLLSGGLLGLLMLNTALNEGSFERSRLERQTTELTDRQQTLQQEIDQQSAPDALERRARELGMVPGGDLAFLQDDGSVNGKPAKAEDSPPVKRTDQELWSRPGASPTPAAPPPADTGVQIDPAPPLGTAPPAAAPSAASPSAAPSAAAPSAGGTAR
ncbi:septum formation initiator family protein [Kitasatospora sp. NPDC096147]|uniref:FtsB family cell division protein n=1 Tax=Kitasatospora sp. NPDC096147 TaxID=3364093 RepID=UPI003827714A